MQAQAAPGTALIMPPGKEQSVVQKMVSAPERNELVSPARVPVLQVPSFPWTSRLH